jgi:outer membrane lipoprotein SlyB
MKKLFTILLAVVLLSVAAMPSFAQGRVRRNRVAPTQYSRVYNQRTYSYYQYRDRSVWDKHRDKLTVGAGAGAGAILGAIIGGKKGALIGALAGGGGSALYTYKLRDRNRYYRR